MKGSSIREGVKVCEEFNDILVTWTDRKERKTKALMNTSWKVFM